MSTRRLPASSLMVSRSEYGLSRSDMGEALVSDDGHHEGAYVEHDCMDTTRFTQEKESLKVMGTGPDQAFRILEMGGSLWALFSSQFQDRQQKEKRHTSEGNWASDDDGLGYQANWHVSQHALLQRVFAAYFAHCRHVFLQCVLWHVLFTRLPSWMSG